MTSDFRTRLRGIGERFALVIASLITAGLISVAAIFIVYAITFTARFLFPTSTPFVIQLIEEYSNVSILIVFATIFIFEMRELIREGRITEEAQNNDPGGNEGEK